jgi:predicted Zn-dependent protease
MSVELWTDITESNSGSDGESGRGRLRGEQAAARTERAAQRLVRASATAPLPTGRVRVAAGGSAVG